MIRHKCRIIPLTGSLQEATSIRNMASVLVLLLIMTALAVAQPVITGGPVNAASYALASLPNASIAQGSMFILFDRNMGPPALLSASAFPLQTNLGPTSI